MVQLVVLCVSFLELHEKKRESTACREKYTFLRTVQEIDMERNDFFKACQNHAIGKKTAVEYDSIAYYPIAYQLAYNADGTVRHTAVLQDVKSKALVYCRLQDVQGKI